MRIAHISDLHCGPDLNERMLRTAIKEINDLNPDLVVVTGDLTENGYLPEFRLAKEYLSSLTCEKVVIGSGNHDYRHTGYLICSKLFPRPEVVELDGFAVIYLSSARPDRDEGEVGLRQIRWLERLLTEKYQDHFTIVALHHHLIPIPDTGVERNTVNDAGDVLRTLISKGVKLTLCGHRHRPWMWTLERLPIVHAGSVSSKRLRGYFKNTYNVITIENGCMEVNVKVVGGKLLRFSEVYAPEIP